MFAGLVMVFLAVLRGVSCKTYTLSPHLTGQTFLDSFVWSTNPDPNWGRVTYVSYETAQANGLVSVEGNKVTLRADHTTTLSSTGPGRDSFDLVSKKQYTNHVAIFDIQHMPEGCGTWPAELGEDWPNGGEIDILEGVNNQPLDTITFHSGSNCTMPSSRPMSGTGLGTNCDAYETGNESCGVKVNTPNSFGPGFNANGGGWYAIERARKDISVYFWERNDPSVPEDVSNPGETVDTCSWGLPTAYFPSTQCDFGTHLSPFKIVIDLDLCGAWAGTVYGSSGCPSTCTDFVNSNPSAFTNAYFTFNSLTIFE